MENEFKNRWDQPVTDYLNKSFLILKNNLSVNDALNELRKVDSDKINYFYVVDENEKLKGVLPTRKIITAQPQSKLEEIMIPNVISIPANANLLEACEFFILYKFLAFPVVDSNKNILGVIDVSLFTNEVMELVEKEQSETIFETIGFHVSSIKNQSATKIFRYRFPWLLATILSGTFCAILAGFYELTLQQSIVIAFFMALVLGLGESVSIQSMTVTIQTLKLSTPSFSWYLKTLKKEAIIAILLGLACGSTVSLLVYLWQGYSLPVLIIGSSIVFSLFMASLIGLSIPWLLHSLKLDPKIAAGPVTLAITDISTLLIYLSIAKFVLF